MIKRQQILQPGWNMLSAKLFFGSTKSKALFGAPVPDQDLTHFYNMLKVPIRFGTRLVWAISNLFLILYPLF